MQQALGAFTQLTAVLPDLTLDEIVAVLELESQSTRRKSTIDRLIARAVRLNELAYGAELDARYRHPGARAGQA
jgi:hypothetical protein